MNEILNPVTVIPSDLKSGDVMAVIVTCHITRSPTGLRYRLYRCPYPDSVHNGIPQGGRIAGEGAIASQLFPVLGYAGATPDSW